MCPAVLRSRTWISCLLCSALAGGCADAPSKQWSCLVETGAAPDAVDQIGCLDDFLSLASAPLAPGIPGARSVKTSIDREADFALAFQNSVKFPVHWDFLSTHRSAAQGLRRVPGLADFNRTEYYSPSRRFLLGTLTRYAGPDKWVYEIAPYDTADTDMIRIGYERVLQSSFVGRDLYFHPTSLNGEAQAERLPASVRRVSTAELFAGIDYQPLNLAESVGQLRFVTAAELETRYVSFRDIVVLDRVPNDISVTLGIITSEFQTPLSHVNVLSQNRGTPNMALRGAQDRPELQALEGEWVRLRVGESGYEITRVERAEADAWWDANRPQAVLVPGLDESVTDLRDIESTVDASADDRLAAIKAATRAFGGKAAGYGALSQIEGLPLRKAFAVPIYYYKQFMRENAFDQRVEESLADPLFLDSPEERDRQLEQLRDAMRAGAINTEFERLLLAKLAAEYSGLRMRFRSSTNAEDLDGFTGAGLYTSKSGDPNDDQYPVFDAIRKVWASAWSFKAFEERTYRGIEHQAVAMGLLVHQAFPDEESNGVALTNNPFDRSGLDPAFYVNVQPGEASVVLPEPGFRTEEFLYYFDASSQPVSYLGQSNLVPEGVRVLSNGQVQRLGVALAMIRDHFAPVYAPPARKNAWWAMDVEFKFDDEAGNAEPALFIKQARPFGNR